MLNLNDSVFIPPILLVIFILFPINLVAAEKPFIISGFDDVLRQADNTGILNSAIKIFEEDKTFAGMPELYKIISSEYSIPKFVIVSAISSWFDSRINNFLIDSNYPPHRRYLRNWLTEWSIENFKISKIKIILSDQPARKFIVIFDNSDASNMLAKILHVKFPNQIQAIYLRKIVEKELPGAAISFFTAFDIALAEFISDRMIKEEVEIVGNAILKEQNVSLIFPDYAICPKNHNPCSKVVLGTLQICEKVQNHVQLLCQHREH